MKECTLAIRQINIYRVETNMIRITGRIIWYRRIESLYVMREVPRNSIYSKNLEIRMVHTDAALLYNNVENNIHSHRDSTMNIN